MEGRFLHFGKFRLDLRSGELFQEDRTVRLPPQPTKLLLLLARSPGALVTHDEIQRELWGEDTFVDFEQAVKKCAKQVRTALGDDAEEPVYVETVPRRGYRFIGPVRGEGGEPPPDSGLSAFQSLEREFRIGEWRVEPQSNQIVSGDERVRLDPRVMQVLVCLAERAGEVVPHEQILKKVWEGAFVTDGVLTNAIWELRKAFRDDSVNPRFIHTVPRKGYRLVAPLDPREENPPPRSRRAPAALVLLAAVALAFVGVWWVRRNAAPGEVQKPRFQLSLPRGVNLPVINFNVFAISPDGKRVAFVGCADESRVDRGSGCRLYLRDRSSIDALPLAGTEGAESPFFSPDGRWVAFAAKGKLRKLSLDDGAVVVLADARVGRGGSWAEDGTILFSQGGGGLLRVSEGGGEVQEVTKRDPGREVDHRWPQILPGGRAALLEVLHEPRKGGSRGHDITVVDLETGERRVLVESGGTPKYADGHVLFGRDGVLYAAPIDLERLELTRVAAPVLEGVFMWSSPGEIISFAGNVNYDVSPGGTLLFSPREASLPRRRLVRVDRHGRRESLSKTRLTYNEPQVSPDGNRVAVAVEQDVGRWGAFVIELFSDASTKIAEDVGPRA
jgi:DNA-binding winged helix-turn-helix (wHTH) protein